MSKRNNLQNLKRSKTDAKYVANTLKRSFQLLWKNHKLGLIQILFFVFLNNLGTIFNQLFIGKIVIDNFITPAFEQSRQLGQNMYDVFDWNNFWIWVFLAILFFAITIFSQLMYQWISIKITYVTIAKMRRDLYKHIQGLPIKYFDQQQKGELLTRFTSDVDTLRQFLSQSIPVTINALITIVVSFSLMVWFSWILTIITILLVAFVLFIIKILGKQTGKFFQQRQIDNGQLSGFAEEMFAGLKVIKAFNYEDESFLSFQKINKKLYTSERKASNIANLMFPIIYNWGNVIFALISIIGGLIITSKNPEVIKLFGLSIGTLVSFTQFVRSFTRPIVSVAQQSNVIIMATAGAKRVFDIFDEQLENNEGKITLVKVLKTDNKYIEKPRSDLFSLYAWKIPTNNGFKYELVKGEVEFKNVWFGYNDQNMILKNVSLHAYPGEKIAFVGPTGAGKTTIINLLNRFYEIQQGNIYYDGINIKDIDKKSLRQSLTMVLQDTNLFSDTIKNNIGYGADNIIDDLVARSANIANISYYIENQQDRYDTYLLESGSELSQGQKQLLSIARASYQDTPVVILDEATSNIDTKTEFLVQQAMDSLMNNRTSFIIAHRLSTIKNASKIIVLNNGEIIETGSHDQLISQKGFYYNLWKKLTELA
ncbi:ABC transporter ATP-binding protein [Mycoplasmopsis sturni]|uniref:ABC transporter ATP-binding protein n=1 Tax=Mycoplasmopsis sturni TaxID=39047 RepID=UPI00055DBCFD|nr:ABC transporter ATP-binding protein [Mycoplasmopsis sturni]